MLYVARAIHLDLSCIDMVKVNLARLELNLNELSLRRPETIFEMKYAFWTAVQN